MSRPAVRLHDTAGADAAVAEPPGDSRQFWLDAFRAVRAETERRAAPLSAEDQVVQSMPDASPAKWHRAHVTWFFEQFLLRPFAPSYRPFDERFAFLFNSYYVAAGPRQARPQRGLITRPGVAETTAYRAHVDAAVAALIETDEGFRSGVADRRNRAASRTAASGIDADGPPARFCAEPHEPGLRSALAMAARVEHAATAAGCGSSPAFTRSAIDGAGFSFDNERPAHQVLLQPVRVARALVTNGEWLEFMADGGYTTPALWLSDGWDDGRGAGLVRAGLLAA